MAANCGRSQILLSIKSPRLQFKMNNIKKNHFSSLSFNYNTILVMLSIPLLSIDHESNLYTVSLYANIYQIYKKPRTLMTYRLRTTVSVVFFRGDDLFFTLRRTYPYIQNVLFIFYTQWKLYNDKIQKLNRVARVKIFINGCSLLHIIYYTPTILLRVRFYNMMFCSLLYLLCLASKYYMAYGAYNNIQCLLRITENCPRSRARNTRTKSNRRVLSSCTYNKSVLYNSIIVVIVLTYEFGRVLLAVNLRVALQLLSFV